MKKKNNNNESVDDIKTEDVIRLEKEVENLEKIIKDLENNIKTLDYKYIDLAKKYSKLIGDLDDSLMELNKIRNSNRLDKVLSNDQ